MEEKLVDIWKHMVRLGRGALAHAVGHSAYSSMDNDTWAELSVLQAAHAAEIFIKARIAQEHPLLIFETLPKRSTLPTGKLTFESLIERGKTLQFSDLPDRLWAATGIDIVNRQAYDNFGRFRNCIQHFASPEKDCSLEALSFIFEVIDLFINECWGLFAIDHNEDDEPYQYLIECLIRRDIPFLVSPGAGQFILGSENHMILEWPEAPAYRELMELRFRDHSLEQ